MKQPRPFVFDEFFASGLEESVSPFLTSVSRRWGKNLSLKSSLFSAFLLLTSFSLWWFIPDLSFLLLLPIYFLMGIPALIKALENLKNLEINIDMLMTSSAFLSLIIGSPFEGALLLVLFEISGALETTVSIKAKSALHNLNKLSPSTAFVIAEDGSIHEKSLRQIEIGEKVLAKAGEIIPLDGIVTEGTSNVNLVHLTGESLPILKTVGDTIPAGALNMEGTLTLQVTREGSDSTLSRIIQMITLAHQSKPQIERWVWKFGKYYASSIILLTFAFALLLPLFFSLPFLGIEGSIYRALTFLIAASPCALVLAIPTAYLSALSVCANRGILLKGGAIFDALNQCGQIAFDKTGTLTKATLVSKSIEPLFATSFPIETALRAAAALERNSSHPIAIAICKLAEDRPLPKIENFVSLSGYGVEAEVILENQKMKAFMGLPSYFKEKLSEENFAFLQKKIHETSQKGYISSLFVIEENFFLFTFQDIIRPHVKEMIHELKEKHSIRPFILTGDIKPNALLIGQQIDIETIYADLRPQDKLQIVSVLSEKEGLAMVGDGINDAPALARATVGISMGKIGSATAIDASDIILLHDQIHQLSWLFDKARTTHIIVKQNISFALFIIGFFSIPALVGLLPLWLAVCLHEGGTLIVGLNSLRLFKK